MGGMFGTIAIILSLATYIQDTTVSGTDSGLYPITNKNHNSPGRFFSTDLMKLVLAIMVSRYDIKLPANTKPNKRYFGEHEIPDFNMRVLVKATGNR